MKEPIERQLVDTMVEAYVDWRQESGAVWEAYSRWSAMRGDEAGHAFAAYQAALDRERQAADVYATLTRRVADLVRTNRGLARAVPADGGGA